MEKKKMNEEKREQVAIEIAEQFTKCDQYSKGFIAGFIEAIQATKKNGSDSSKSKMQPSI